MLIELVSQESLDRFRPIPILSAPSGVSNFIYDENKPIADYIKEGWKLRYAKLSQDDIVNVNGRLRAQRRQYGLKHYVTSTVHANIM